MPSYTLEERATALGKAHGMAVGSWVIDGNTTRETAARILLGIDEGDPEVMDMAPAPLSGEWADSPTPSTIATTLGIVSARFLDVACDAYEAGFSEGYWEEVQRAALAIIG